MPVSHVFTCGVADDPAAQAAGMVLPSHWNSAHSVTLATNEVIKWVSAGTESISSGTVVFSNSNGVSFGMNAGTITATVVPGAAAGIAALAGGTQTATSGTVVFADSNGITFGMSGSTRVTASHNGLTSQSNQALSGSNGSFAFQTATFGALNGLTFYTSNGSMVGSYTVPSTAGLLSNINASAGTTSNNLSNIVFSDSNRVSFGLNGSTVTAKHALNFSAGTTSQNVSDQIVFSNSNNVSFGLNGSTITGTATFAQSNQSAIKAFGASNTGNTAGNTGVSTGIDWVVAGSNNITISESTAGGGPNTLWISGPSVAGAQTGISGIANSETTYTSGSVYLSERANITINSSVNGASQYYRFSVAAQSNQSAIKAFGASNTGNTAGNTGVSTGVDWVLAATNNITVSESTAAGGPNTLWLSGAAAGGGGSLNISAGTTSNNLTNVVFSDSNRVSFGLNGSTITAKHALNFSAGTTSQNVSDQIVFSNSNGVSFGLNGSTITGSVGNNVTHSFFEPARMGSTAAMNDGTLIFQACQVSGYVTATMAHYLASISVSTSSNSSHGGSLSVYLGIYTNNAGTLSSASSGSTQYVWTVTSNNSANRVSQRREMTIPINVNLTPGDYWFGMLLRSSTANANWFTCSVLGNDAGGQIGNQFNLLNQLAGQTLNLPGHGLFSASTAGIPGTVSIADITGIGSNGGASIPYVALLNTTF